MNQEKLDTSAPAVDPADKDGDDSFVKGQVATNAAVAETAAEENPPSREDYDAAIAKMQARVDEAKLQVKEAQDVLAAAQRECDEMIVDLDRRFPPLTHSQQVKAHLAREAERRAERVGAANRMNQAAGAAVVPVKASPLDAAINRRQRSNPRLT